MGHAALRVQSPPQQQHLREEQRSQLFPQQQQAVWRHCCCMWTGKFLARAWTAERCQHADAPSGPLSNPSLSVFP